MFLECQKRKSLTTLPRFIAIAIFYSLVWNGKRGLISFSFTFFFLDFGIWGIFFGFSFGFFLDSLKSFLIFCKSVWIFQYFLWISLNLNFYFFIHFSYGFVQSSIWNIFEFSLGFLQILFRFFLEFSVMFRFSLDFLWIPFGFSLDSLWNHLLTNRAQVVPIKKYCLLLVFGILENTATTKL